MSRRLCGVALALAVAACRPPAPANDSTASVDSTVVFRGMCDASGAVPVGDGRFVVADDEDNVLRLYDARLGGDPLALVDVSSVVGASEADFEGAARLGQVAFWMSSHGLRRDGDLRRSWLLATTAPEDGSAPAPFGVAYDGLLGDLLDAPLLRDFGLAEAHTRVPKAPGGLNLEGLTRHADGTSLLIGFRNPRPEGKALVVALTNPLEVVQGARAKFGAVELLALDGLGIRAMAFSQGRYLLSAGAVDDERPSRLFVWSGVGDPVAVALDVTDLNPEAIVAWDSQPDVLVLSDDGGVKIDGKACKALDAQADKRFRGRWLTVP